MSRATNLVAALAMTISLASSSLMPIAAGGSPEVHIADAHFKAIGGVKAINKLKTIHRFATVSGTSAYGPVSGTADEITDLENKRSYSSMDVVGYSTKSGLVGNKGWKWDTISGDSQMPPTEIELSKHSIGPSVLASMYEAHGDGALSIGGQQEFNGAACTEITFAASPMKIYVDKKTSLLRGYTAPDLTVNLSDYKAIDGVQFPGKRSMTIASQKLTLKYNYTESKSNVTVDESKFASRSGGAKTEPPAAPKYTAEQIIGFLDKDSDGKISNAESSPEIKTSFAYIDANKDGLIDLKEAEAMLDYAKSQKTQTAPATPIKRRTTAKEIVASMDKDSDGKISKKEASEDLLLFFTDFDGNKDGVIDAKEAVAIAKYVNENQ